MFQQNANKRFLYVSLILKILYLSLTKRSYLTTLSKKFIQIWSERVKITDRGTRKPPVPPPLVSDRDKVSLNNFCGTLEMSCNCQYTSSTQNNSFPINDTKLYVPVVSSSSKEIPKLFQKCSLEFKRTVKWNRKL